MLPCARSCAGQKIQPLPVASTNFIVNEPLWFLYPRWLQQPGARQRHSFSNLSKPTRLRPPKRPTHANVHPACESARPILSASHGRPKPAVEEDSLHVVGKSTSASKLPTSSGSMRLRIKGLKQNGRFNPSEIDGPELLRLLSKVPVGRTHHYAEKSHLSARFLDHFTGTTEKTSWFHREGSGCRITVLPSTRDDPKLRVVLLDGSRQACVLALQYLKNQAIEFALTSTVALRTNLKKRFSLGAAALAPKEYIRVDEIQKPEVWTIRSFHDYVKAITCHKSPRAVERIAYSGSETYNLVAGRMLSDLFSNPALHVCYSTAALRQALRFFSTRTELATDAGSVWYQACEAGIIPDIACFNFELERSLTVNNVDRVRYLFHRMTKLEVRPSVETWALFLKLSKSWTDRLRIVRFLLQKRSMDPVGDEQYLARAIVKTDLKRFVEDDTGLTEFAGGMAEIFGTQWLTPVTVTEMIQQCIETCEFKTISEILALAEASNISIEQETSRTLVDAVRRAGDLQDTITLLKACTPVQNLSTFHASAELVFLSAWKNGMYNMCRAIWHYAATHGSITYAMQRKVFQSIGHNVEADKTSASKITEALMAALTIGTDIDLINIQATYPKLYESIEVTHPLGYLCQWTPKDGTRHEQLQFVHTIMEQDLTAWKRFKPMEASDLIKSLEAAYVKDAAWQDDDGVVINWYKDAIQHLLEVKLQRKSPDDASLASTTAQRHIELSNLPQLAEQIRPKTKDTQPDQEAAISPITESPQKQEEDHELEKKRFYNFFSAGSSTCSVHTTSDSPALALAGSCIIDVLFQHLRLAWETG